MLNQRVQTYNDDDRTLSYREVKKIEEKVAFYDILKDFYQILVPIIGLVAGAIKLLLGCRLFMKVMTESRRYVRRDFHIKLGPMLNPTHLALLDMLSGLSFLIIPFMKMVLKKEVDSKMVLYNIVTDFALFIIMQPFTSFMGTVWLFGLNIMFMAVFWGVGYFLQHNDKNSKLLNENYSL